MFEVNKYTLQLIGIWICLTVFTLASLVIAQQAQPYQYAPPPYQQSFTHERRRFNAPSYSGFNDGSLAPNNRELIKFPDDSMSPVGLVHGVSDQYNFNERHKKDNRYSGDHSSHSQKSNEDSFVPLNVTQGVDTYDDFFNLLDEDSRKELEVISPRFGGDVERSAGKMATPAGCIPEMTVVPLKLSDGSDIKDPSILVFPSCTRVKRCGGCCVNNLLSCQPIETNNIIYEVYKSRYVGGKVKLQNKELVEVEEHTRCKCDCRKKESDCTKFQRYNKAQCMCICINIEDKNKCLTESSEKIWDAESCTCRCRESKECSTGTYYDENTCSCKETPGHRHTQQVADRRRLITKPVIYVPETPETFYNSDT